MRIFYLWTGIIAPIEFIPDETDEKTMQIDQNVASNANFIRSYGEGHIVVVSPLTEPVNDETQSRPRSHDIHTIEENVIISRSDLHKNDLPENPQSLDQSHISRLQQLKPELVILGTGKDIRFPDQRITMELWKNGIGIEVMNTSAACRTFNYLIADGRNVVAAIFMI